MTQELVLVTGGTGKTGRRVARRLDERGVPTRVVSRSTTPRLDWSDEATWDGVLDEVTAIYLAPSDAGRAAVGAFTRRAVERGVRRVVLLSARGVADPGHFDDREALQDLPDSEAAVAASGAAWSVVRPGWFMQNFDEGDFVDGVRTGRLALAAGDQPVAWIDAEDIAAVAVALLLEDGHEGEVVEMSGPRALTVGEAVALIARAVGRPVEYVPLTPEAYRRQLEDEGTDAAEARIANAGLSAIRKGSEAPVLDGVRRILGRDPATFEEFVDRSVDAWR